MFVKYPLWGHQQKKDGRCLAAYADYRFRIRCVVFRSCPIFVLPCSVLYPGWAVAPVA